MRVFVCLSLLAASSVPALGANSLFDFEQGLSGWVQSKDPRYAGSNWHVEEQGIKTGTPHKFYGLSNKLQEPVKCPDGFVVQYEVKFSEGVTCSGAYLKLLSYDEAFDGEKLVEASPYSIMFGPDNCGHTSKVHLIFRQQNPVTQKWEEKHMAATVPSPKDKLSHLYTLELRSDNTFAIKVDGEEKKAGSLLDDNDFKPPFSTPAEIDDPNDKKPSDWVDSANMEDPNAVKPDDWDEDAPQKIVDPQAVKPKGWNDDAPAEIPDPAASKPEDWSDEDDGPWEAPVVKNPACSVGCGEWKAPLIANPAYKGKWSRPQIPNPAYKGVWKPRKIPNPAYFVESNPLSTIAPVGAIAIEILANDKGISFNNLMIGNDIAEASAWATQVFAKKHAEEVSNDAEMRKVREKESRLAGYEKGDLQGIVNYYIGEFADLLGVTPTVAGPLIVFFFFCLGGLWVYSRMDKVSPLHASEEAARNKKTDASTKDTAEEEDEDADAAQADDEDLDDDQEEEEKPKSGLQRRIPKAN